MIIDSHCHIWARWPYDPPVPDPETRAAPEHLIWHMDRNGVDRAVVICAGIGDNPDNAGFAFAAADRFPGRLEVFPDLECRWSPDYRTPGAAARLRAALARWPMRGFTSYLDEAETGDWLTGPEGRAFFELAAEHRLIASLSVLPHQVPQVAALARAVPGLTILLHHMAFLGPRSAATRNGPALVAAAADCAGIHVKLSGAGNVAGPDDAYPWPALAWIGQLLVAAFGPERLVWGSDFPVSSRHMTYRQALDMVARHGPGPQEARAAMLGGTMARLLAAAGPGQPATPPPIFNPKEPRP